MDGFNMVAIVKGFKMIRFLMIICCMLTMVPGILAAQKAPAPREGEIRGAVEEFVKNRTANMGLDVTVKRISTGGTILLPPGPAEYEVVAPRQWEGGGSASIAVVVRQNGAVVRNVPVRVEVEALADMVVALRQIESGAVISDKDLAVQKRDLASVSGRCARNIAEAAGYKTRVPLRPNMPLRLDQLEKVPLVKPGQMVTIVAENEVMKVTVTGKVKSPGAAGDTVMVQNLNSLKEIPALVVNASTVQVSF